MNYRDLTIQFQKEEKYIEAIDAYEKFFKEGDPIYDDYIDLAVIYHDIQRGGLALNLGITVEEFQKMGPRFTFLLDEAEEKFGACTEIDFWRKYTDWVHIGIEFDCEELAERGDSLIPYFFLLVTTPDPEEMKKYVPKCEELYKQVKDKSTIKKQIIESFIRRGFEDIERHERKKLKQGK